MATAATTKSVEVTAKEASSGEKYNNLSGIKTSEFTYNTTTGGLENTVIELVELPAGAEIIGYAMTNEAWGTSVTLALGTAAEGTQLAAAVDIAAAGNDSALFAPVALGTTNKVYGHILAAAADADKDLNGVILYI